MFTFPFFRRQDDRPTARRPQPRRRPLLEDLEGRQLLSTFGGGGVGQHIGVSTAAIQGGHIGSNGVASAIQGGHIGSNGVASEIVGNHIG